MRPAQKPLPRFAAPTLQRSRNMAAIRSKGNGTTEWRLRSLLIRGGIRGWKLHGFKEIGSPDFYFANRRVAVFVHGCFWHGCLRCGHIPTTNSKYWSSKLERNMRRDARVRRTAMRQGNKVVTIWECELRNRAEQCIAKIRKAIQNS